VWGVWLEARLPRAPSKSLEELSSRLPNSELLEVSLATWFARVPPAPDEVDGQPAAFFEQRDGPLWDGDPSTGIKVDLAWGNNVGDGKRIGP